MVLSDHGSGETERTDGDIELALELPEATRLEKLPVGDWVNIECREDGKGGGSKASSRQIRGQNRVSTRSAACTYRVRRKQNYNPMDQSNPIQLLT